VAVRTRDADNPVLVVNYSDVRRSKRNGGDVMPTLLVGDGSSAGDIVQLVVRPSDTVVVAVNAASANSLQLYTNGIDQASTQINAGSNQSLTTAGPSWVQATSGGGVATVQVTGGMYGGV
jgi:hypothetical protein